MKSLTQYLTEMYLQKVDYSKHNYKYVNDVINDLLNNRPIKLGKNGETIANIDPLEQSEFRKKWDDGKIPETKEDFDLLMSNYPSFPKWNEIFKGQYSGQDSQSFGQLVEALVCYIFNKGEDSIDKWMKNNIPDLSKTWINSCKWTVDFINRQKGVSEDVWNNNNYIAYRVDGGDCGTDDVLVMDIVSLFRGKEQMNKMLKSKNINITSCNDLYSGPKDTWNKADIVLVHKVKSANFFEEMNSAGVVNGETLNNYLIEKTIDGTIIPISLKQLSSENAHLSEVNIKQKELPIGIISEVVGLRIADKYQNNTTVGTIDILCKNIDGEDVSITFRRTTEDNANNLSVEPKPTKGVSRFGKAVNVMKSILNIKRGNDYYVYAKSNNEALKELKSYFGKDKIQISPKSNYNECNPLWKDRACVAGLLGMLNEYKSKITYGEDENFITQFANFCMLSAMGLNSKGAFYKIS